MQAITMTKNEDHSSIVDRLTSEVETAGVGLPPCSAQRLALLVASRLVETAGFDRAQCFNTEGVVELILIAARLERLSRPEQPGGAKFDA